MRKIDFRTIPEEQRTDTRKHAIKMIQSGQKKKDVAAKFGVKPGTISDWIKRYDAQGEKGLKAKKSGANPESKKLLTREQEVEIREMIFNKKPNQVNLNFPLWTRDAVKELIHREYKLTLGYTTIGDYLYRWDFSTPNPQKLLHTRTSNEIKQWINDDYQSIKKLVHKENAEIYWGGWTLGFNKKGERRNKFFIYSSKGKLQFMIYSIVINESHLEEFVKQLVKNNPRKIYLMLHTPCETNNAKLKKSFSELGEFKDKLSVFFPPLNCS